MIVIIQITSGYSTTGSRCIEIIESNYHQISIRYIVMTFVDFKTVFVEWHDAQYFN